MRASVLLALLAAVALGGDRSVRADEPPPLAIAVIVGNGSAVTRVSVDDLHELYLRRRRLWPDGKRAIPVNLPPDHPARERFSRLVLGRSTKDLASYWDARYFEGITPPAVLPSATAVRAYLAAEPAAIAYLPLADVDDTCRTLLVLGR